MGRGNGSSKGGGGGEASTTSTVAKVVVDRLWRWLRQCRSIWWWVYGNANGSGGYGALTMVERQGTSVKMVGLRSAAATSGVGVGLRDHRHCCCCCRCIVTMEVIVASSSHLHSGGCRVIVETGRCCRGVSCLPHPFCRARMNQPTSL